MLLNEYLYKTVKVVNILNTLQDAQLSQRYRAARCVIVLAKSERFVLGDNILRTL